MNYKQPQNIIMTAELWEKAMRFNFVNHIRQIKLSKRDLLLPLFEAIVNSIDAIDEAKVENSEIIIRVDRERSLFHGEDKKLEPISSFEIIDNGIGFTNSNFESFTEVNSEKKMEYGGKGVGRLIWLKMFDSVSVESTYSNGDGLGFRSFDFELDAEPVKNLVFEENTNFIARKTSVKLNNIKQEFLTDFPVGLETISYQIVEHCLEYFVLKRMPPTVIIKDEIESISLHEIYNEWVASTDSNEFHLQDNKFKIHHFLVNARHQMTHRINYCAIKRVVVPKSLDSSTVPNLPKRIISDDGLDQLVYMGYVSSSLLDNSSNVNPSRTAFTLPDEGQFKAKGEVYWTDIVFASIEKAKLFLEEFTYEIEQKKLSRVHKYIAKYAPQYKWLIKNHPEIIRNIDLNSSDTQLEESLHRAYHNKMIELGKTATEILEAPIEDLNNPEEEINKKYDKFLDEWNEMSKSTLAQYVVQRKKTLILLKKFLRLKEDGKYQLEKAIHRLIFPMNSTSDEVPYSKQSLWIIDEKLAFHEYLASDKQLKETAIETKDSDRLDLLLFDRPIALSDDKPIGGITIVEFKRPMLPSGNPVDQMLGYIEKIKDRTVKTWDGREIHVGDTTPFFCYAICDLDNSMRKKLSRMQLRVTPDDLGYYGYYDSKEYNAYVEVISYSKLIEDAERRNRILFQKLNIIN